MARSRKKADQTVEQNLEPVQYQVIRPLRISSATTLPIGARVTPSDNWPHRRAKQFVDQGFLVPVPANAVKPESPVSDQEPDDDTGDEDATE